MHPRQEQPVPFSVQLCPEMPLIIQGSIHCALVGMLLSQNSRSCSLPSEGPMVKDNVLIMAEVDRGIEWLYQVLPMRRPVIALHVHVHNRWTLTLFSFVYYLIPQ